MHAHVYPTLLPVGIQVPKPQTPKLWHGLFWYVSAIIDNLVKHTVSNYNYSIAIIETMFVIIIVIINNGDNELL